MPGRTKWIALARVDFLVVTELAVTRNVFDPGTPHGPADRGKLRRSSDTDGYGCA